MNLDPVRRVADSVLYEGYVLYPYRASAQKNRSRWQFGVVMPPGYAAVDPTEPSVMQTECVLSHDGQPAVEVIVRFLQVQRRFDGQSPWDEAVEQEVTVDVADLLGGGCALDFDIPGEVRGIRRRERLSGRVHVQASVIPGPWRAVRLGVRIENLSVAGPLVCRRDQALPWALVAAHTIIAASGGSFVSMTDPPEWAKTEAEACRNIGCWPVLAAGQQVVLSSAIILPDHPRIAPESPCELYDGTEIDEILTLRTLALSDAEKLQARATDPRSAALIDRVESLDLADFERMHGRMHRAVHEPEVPWWDPEASPGPDAVIVAGQQITRGSRVTLRPGTRRADAQDMFLAGREAIVEAVLTDVDGASYLAVSLTDEPDLLAAHGRFRYFSPDEVEP